MIQLYPGFNAIRWTSETVPISTVPFAALIIIVYTPNPVTGEGFFTFESSDKSPNMNVFAKGFDYLVVVTAAFLLTDAVTGNSSLFTDIPSYVPAVADTAPTMPIGRTETGVAAEDIISGRLVAQTPQGLRLYSASIASHRGWLFGIALNNARAGGSVSVRRPGYVYLKDWGLPEGASLLAGEDGKLVTTIAPPSFMQPIGRAISSEAMIYQPGEIVTIVQPKSTT